MAIAGVFITLTAILFIAKIMPQHLRFGGFMGVLGAQRDQTKRCLENQTDASMCLGIQQSPSNPFKSLYF